MQRRRRLRVPEPSRLCMPLSLPCAPPPFPLLQPGALTCLRPSLVLHTTTRKCNTVRPCVPHASLCAAPVCPASSRAPPACFPCAAPPPPPAQPYRHGWTEVQPGTEQTAVASSSAKFNRHDASPR
jgi:hypothetical protein